MKAAILCAALGGAAFFLAAYQAGLFQNLPQAPADENAATQGHKTTKAPAKARFPQDLTPATRAEPVPRAAAFDPKAKTHRVVVLKTTGVLYQDWQDKLKEAWQADSVESTELVLVVGPQRKIFVDVIPYPKPAPPITRYKFEVEVSIVEAKTGNPLAFRKFINMPRNIQRIETWNTTALGSPVEFRTVFYWLAASAHAGFPPIDNPPPIVNIAN